MPDPRIEQREALIDQCAYLIDELDALEPLLEHVPVDLLEARPLGKWSIKETLGHLNDCDVHVFLPRLERIVADEAPVFEKVDQDALVEVHDWNAQAVDALLRQLRSGRTQVVAFLNALPPKEWGRTGRFPDGEWRTIYDIALYMARHDAHHLRTLAYRLHESNLTARPQDLPK